jgi:predicted small secreted protein
MSIVKQLLDELLPWGPNVATGTALVAAAITVFANSATKGAGKDIEKISQTVRASANTAQLRALEALVEKLPEDISGPEFKELIAFQLATNAFVGSGVKSEDQELVEDLVTNYHEQALSQAAVQFWFSVAAATVGFLYIIFAALAGDGTVGSYVKILPGVVVDAIAALFFRQAEQTRVRATELYDRLRKDRQMFRAEAVVTSIEDLNIRSLAKAQIAFNMVGLVPKEMDLTTFLSAAGKKKV